MTRDDRMDRTRSRQHAILGAPQRIEPLDREANADFIVESTHRLRLGMLGDVPKMTIDEVPQIMATMLHHPRLWNAFSGLSIAFMGEGHRLSSRLRQLAILRALWRCGAPYAWGEHVLHGKRADLTSEEIDRVTIGPDAPEWSDVERAAVRAADELHDDSMIGDETWDALAEQLDAPQLFELVVAIGHMSTVAYLQNAIRLSLGDHNAGLAAR